MTKQERDTYICKIFEDFTERRFADKVLAEENDIKNGVWEKIYTDVKRSPDLINSPYLEKYIIPLLVPIINLLQTGIPESERDFFKWEAISECILRFFEYDPYKKEGRILNGAAFFKPIIHGVKSRILYFGKGYQTNTERFVDKYSFAGKGSTDEDTDELSYDVLYQKNKECFKTLEEYQNEKLYEEYSDIFSGYLKIYTPSYAKKLAAEEFLRRHPDITKH